jgi:dienelactone hydrolase
MTGLDPMDRINQLFATAPLQLTFDPAVDVPDWQRELRGRIIDLIGGIPAAADDLAPEIDSVVDFPEYRRQEFSLQSRPGERVPGYLLTPRTPPPHPVMICVPGHGRGVQDIVGIDENGSQRTEKGGYSYDFAIQAVEHGMAAVAIEPMGFGHRREAAAVRNGPDASSCQPIAAAALLFDQTIAAWRIHDVMRTVDWIGTRSELDATRVGCMGISGGGMVTLFAAALDERIRVAFVSGYLNTFKDSIGSMSHCVDNYIPGILNWCEMYDVAGLIAPRPLFAEFGERDPIFPLAASQASAARVRQIYQALDAVGSFGVEQHPGEHEFSGRLGLPFAADVLDVTQNTQESWLH